MDSSTPEARVAARVRGGHVDRAEGPRLSLSIACAVAALAAGCGGGEGSDGDSPPGPLGGGPPPPAISDTVGFVEAPMANLEQYLLRATLPVPPGLFSGDPSDSLGLGVIDWDGAVRTAQLEVVSRYADAADGADVVELIVPVTRNPELAAGDPVLYEVVVVDQPSFMLPPDPDLAVLSNASAWISPSLGSMLQSPGALVLTARDVHGNRYELDLLGTQVNASWRRFGWHMAELRLTGVMAPQAGSVGALPRMFGVHAYLRVSAQDAVAELDLRFENGGDNSDGGDSLDDPVGKFYFESLDLRLPSGWVVEHAFDDPGLGTAYLEAGKTVFPLVDSIGDGSLHVVPPNAQFHRRLTFAPAGLQARAEAIALQAGRGFVRPANHPENGSPLWSWSNPDTARYFPQRVRIPNLDFAKSQFQQWIDSNFAEVLTHMENGTGAGDYPVNSNRMGWAHPFGGAYGGMTGGDGIYFLEGVRTLTTGSVDGYRRLQLLHRMNTERMPNAYFGADGEPTCFEDWFITDNPNGDPYIELQMNMSLKSSGNDPMGYDSVDTTQAELVASLGLAPDYEATLLNYEHHDAAHLVRYTKNAKALTWLGNDSLARDDLHLQAELARLTYSEVPNGAWGYKAESGLAFDRERVDTYGANGFDFGRAEGWPLDAAVAYYCLADDEWRSARRDWFNLVTELANDGQGSCNGFYQAVISSKFLAGQYRGRNNIEQAIVDQALLSISRSIYDGVDPGRKAMVEDVLMDSALAMISPMAWSVGEKAPWAKTAVGLPDWSSAPFCGIALAADQHEDYFDSTLTWGTLAIGYELSGSAQFLSMTSILAESATALAGAQSKVTSNPWAVAQMLGLLEVQP
jgi:hypothetical protein